ncbi:MAG: hypothetical protein Q3997_07015, partial [Propionibacteriaceae bacterium]|nr:hypothetical protein [Propionibacteriaceae bacterium]
MAVMLAALLAGAVTWLLVPGSGRGQVARLSGVPEDLPRRRGWAWAGAAAALGCAGIASLGGVRALLWAVAAGFAVGTLAG